MTEQIQYDRKDLKILAMKEDIADTRDKNAEYRADLTIAAQRIKELERQVQELNAQLLDLQAPADAGENEEIPTEPVPD